MVGWLLMVCAGGGRHLWLNPVRLVPAIIVGFFFIRFFQSGPFLKSYLNLLHYSFCLIFWIFGHQSCGILAPLLGIEPHALRRKEGDVLTSGPPGKPRCGILIPQLGVSESETETSHHCGALGRCTPSQGHCVQSVNVEINSLAD